MAGMFDTAAMQAALTALGARAEPQQQLITLIVVGGAAMLLGYQSRRSTKDVDAVVVPPPHSAALQGWIAEVAHAQGLPPRWLSTDAGQFMEQSSLGPIIFAAPGIAVYRPLTAQLLAMKLSAWRDDQDIDDANVLLGYLRTEGYVDVETAWRVVAPYVLWWRDEHAQRALRQLWQEQTDESGT